MTSSSASIVLAALGIGLLLYLAFTVFLYVQGRKDDARAWAGFIPDCLVLSKRLLGDSAIPLRAKFLVALLVAYLALPFDLVPDFIPVAGLADDAILAALVLRYVLRCVSIETMAAHWPGPEPSLQLLLKLAGQPGHKVP
jgi:uncharacterized membrane protein YkvA (DUF1232 family)